MKIEVKELKDIYPYYNNPRDNSGAVKPVIESIKRYGFVKPLLCDRDNVIIVGHTRYIAAFQLGLTHVPVVYSDMEEEKAKQFRIADNKLAEKSEFDEDKLIEELKGLEVPEEMQAFFFENINNMINFSYQDFAPSFTPYQGGDDDYSSEGEEFEEDFEETETNYQPSSETITTEQPSSESKPNTETYDNLYRVRIVDGKKMMKVICPYCGNLEDIEVE
jgi:hypothetical protein